MSLIQRSNFSYCNISSRDADNICNLLKGKIILEIGSGNGYLASKLQEKGLQVVATDKYSLDINGYSKTLGSKYFTNVDICSGLEALDKYKYEAVILSWPCYNQPWAAEVILNMKVGSYLLYIGESIGGCTADDTFYDYLHCYYKIIDSVESYVPCVYVYDSINLLERVK